MGRKKGNPRFAVDRMQQLIHGSPAKRKDEEILSKSSLYRAKQAKIRRLDQKIDNIDKRIQDAHERLQTKELPTRKTSEVHSITVRKKLARQRNPSIVNPRNSGKLSLVSRRALERTDETFKCASFIHGATSVNCKPALDGMWSTLVNNASHKDLGNYIESSPKVLSKSVTPILKKKVKEFESSTANAARSLKVLYNGGLISKSKYKDIRSASSLESKTSTTGEMKSGVHFMKGVPIPKILPYDKVISFIHSLNIGMLHDMSAFCGDLDDDNQIDGKYRNIEDLLIKMAKMYLFINDSYYSKDSPLLNWFGEESGKFKVAIGADGAPFGKESEATAWLVSFLNVGSRVACCNDNFLLCGANCKEDHIAMTRFAANLVNAIEIIESKEYTEIIDNTTISFTFELIPADMKWLACYGGELNNAAYYFSSFGNVNADNKEVIGGSLGNSPSDTWHPWDYSHRLHVADQVERLKTKLDRSNLAASTKRTKVLNLIKKEQSRQERVPIIGKLVDKGLAEPLHNTNNAWQHFNKHLMNLVLDISNIPNSIHNVSELPEDCPFLLYLNAIKSKVKCNLLYIKLQRWFQGGYTKPFEYRFTGKESKLFCHNFMYLISAVALSHASPSYQLKIHALAQLGLNLRDAVSLYTRQTLTTDYVNALKKKCTIYFNTCKMFINSVTPTVWTIGHVIPFHAEVTKNKFQLGLGINTMQGREAKHVKIAKYAEHSLPSNRWSLVFRHEYITTFYLRETDPHAKMYKHVNTSYIPVRVQSDEFCYCGFPKDATQEMCTFCCDPLRLAILRSSETGQLDILVCQLLSTSE